MSKPASDAELRQRARILADQADRFLSQFRVDVSDAETFTSHSEEFRLAANAYERMALAEKRVDAAEWYRATNIDGRTSRDIMDQLWEVRDHLQHQDERHR